MGSDKILILLCMGSSCYSRGDASVRETIEKYIEDNQLHERVDFRGSVCIEQCADGPNLKIGDSVFHRIDANSIWDVLDQNLKPLLKE